MKFLRCLLALALAMLPLSEARAASGYTVITVKDAAGVTQNITVLSSTGIVTGNLNWANVICDQSAGTTCASVGTAGSPSTNALTVQAVTLGHGTAANAIRVELPTDGTGLVSAAQSGSWTVTANAGTNLNTSALATTANQTNASQKSQIVDGSGNVISSTSNALNVNVSNALTAIANNADAVASSAGCCSPVANYNYGYNGTTWDRLQVDGSKNLKAGITAWGGTALGTPTNFGTTPGAVVASSANSSMFVGTVAVASGNGVAGTGTPRVTIASDNTAFSVNAVESGTWTVQPGNTANTTPWLTTPSAGTTAGATMYTPFVPAASDNHQTIKNGAGTVYGVTVTNKSATANYIRLYDAGTGFNACNSATGVIFAAEVPPTDSGITTPLAGAVGVNFSTGLSLCVTSGFGLTDTTNATATSMYVNVAYK